MDTIEQGFEQGGRELRVPLGEQGCDERPEGIGDQGFTHPPRLTVSGQSRGVSLRLNRLGYPRHAVSHLPSHNVRWEGPRAQRARQSWASRQPKGVVA
jgi:hypothetical protein